MSQEQKVRVELPNGVVVEVHDGMTESQIRATLTTLNVANLTNATAERTEDGGYRFEAPAGGSKG